MSTVISSLISFVKNHFDGQGIGKDVADQHPQEIEDRRQQILKLLPQFVHPRGADTTTGLRINIAPQLFQRNALFGQLDTFQQWTALLEIPTK